MALEATDPYTMGHSRRVERHVHRTAMAMGLSTHEIRELRIAAALHDVGKICVPDRILRKNAALTPEEMAIVREHVSVGAMMVAGAAPACVTEAILRHHEFWDGHGYPSGLAGENIPMFARVIAIADTWDAVTSARPYKGGEARSRAMDLLSERAGSQFDPDLVEVFLRGLPAALPVTSALLIFLTQHRSTKPVYEWTHSSAFADVSRAAAAAGTAAAVITVGAIGPQVLTAPGDQRPEASGRSPIELIDLIGQGGVDAASAFEASAWAPGFRAAASTMVAERAESLHAGSQGTALVPPTNHIVLPDTDEVPSEASPFEVPNVEPPAAEAPPVAVEPPTLPVEIDPPAPATPPVDVYVPPVIVPLPPVEPPASELPPVTLPPVEEPPLEELPPVEEVPSAEESEDPEAVSPSHPDGAPGHDPEGPGNSEDAPGHADEVDQTEPVAETAPIIEDLPGNSEDAAGHDPEGPGNSEDAPGHADEVDPTEPVAETAPIVEDLPGNSEDAAGHDPEGPGNSEDAPGHADEVDPTEPVAETAPIVEDLPGNSEDAPGHDPEGPGNSEDAPGHADEVDPTEPVAETAPIIEDLPGNSESAPGHDPAGPGNSENAPGHGGHSSHEDLDASEWVSEGETWLEEATSPAA